MDYLSPIEIIVGLVLVGAGFLVKEVVSRLAKDAKDDSTQRRVQAILLPVGLFLVGFYATKIIEIKLEVTNTQKMLTKVDEQQRKSQPYFDAMQSIGALGQEGTLRQLLSGEMEFVTEKLRQIGARELSLKREEVIPKWEKLILHATKTIRATNVVSLDDWKKFSPSEGAEVHQKALANGVKIQRIFIYNGTDPQAKARLVEVAKAQAQWGTTEHPEIRLLSGQWITESPFVSDLLRDIGTQDVVIYDDECVLLTSVDSNGKIVKSVLTASPHTLKQAREFYERLWAEAEKLQ